MEIRDAVAADFTQITAIYNQVLLTSTAIYNDQPVTVEDRLGWWQARRAQHYPVLVASHNDLVAGFASFGDFRPWPGYRFTVEGTVHIHEDARRKGTGALLLAELLHRATLAGKHIMIAGVDSENLASRQFLERSGFQQVGHLREVGHKFDRFLDLIFLQLFLTPTGSRPLDRET